MSIVVIGSVFVDLKGYPDDVFVPDGRNKGHIIQVHGGVSRNVAEDISRAGIPSLMVGLVDPGGIGSDVISRLTASGVDTSHMRQIPNGCGTWLAVFDSRGDVAASISVRPDLTPITDILLTEGEDIFSEADSLVVELDMETETLDAAYSLAQKHHLPVYAVVSNISIALSQKDRLRQTDCFVCNRQEAGMLFGSAMDLLEPEELCRILPIKLRQEDIPRMVVTLGEAGAVYACRNGESGMVPAENVHVADTSGAGDAFFSGVVIGLTAGLSIREACEIGTILASSVITVNDNTVTSGVRELIQPYLDKKADRNTDSI